MDNKLKLKLYPRELLFSVFAFLLPFSLYAERNLYIPWAGYVDEALCIICIVYIIYFSFKRGIRGSDLALLVMLIICSIITFLGNVVSGVTKDLFSILVDFIALAKMFTVFIVYKQVASLDKKQVLVSYLIPLCKLLILSGSVCGFISMFVNIGMTSSKRYGIPAFRFVFANEARYGYIIVSCLLILMLTKLPKKKLIFYEGLTFFNMIITTKGVVYIVLICYVVLSIMWRGKKNTKFTPLNAVFLAIAGTAASSYQINTYIRDSESPRNILIKYGFITANNYFPFGAGFATYASDQAAKNYSSLYYQYGFYKRYGLSADRPMFLNDCYLGMVFGEFGYFGAIVFFLMIIMMFIPLNRINNLGKNAKALTLSVFIGLVVSSVGTAIIKSSIGVFIFAILGIVAGYSIMIDKKSILEES